jgi:hypothetical protein
VGSLQKVLIEFGFHKRVKDFHDLKVKKFFNRISVPCICTFSKKHSLLSQVLNLYESYTAKNWELLAVTDRYRWSECLVCDGRSARMKSQHCETQLSYNLLTSIRIIHRTDKGPCVRQQLYFFRPYFVMFHKIELNLNCAGQSDLVVLVTERWDCFV